MENGSDTYIKSLVKEVKNNSQFVSCLAYKLGMKISCLNVEAYFFNV